MWMWCKGLTVDNKAELILSWNHHEDHQYISINDTSGKLVSQHKDLTDPDEKILDILVFTDYRYFLTATSEGNIFVWKYVTKGRVETARRLIHTFEGHFKAVTSI